MAANVSKLFSLGIVVAGGGGQINQIEAHSINPGWETALLAPDGQVDPNFAAIMRGSPVLSFTTSAITRALTAAGISGLAISGTAVDLWFQKYAQGGIRTSGSNSTKYSAAYGLLCPRTLRCVHNGYATLTYDVWARTNDGGATFPLAVTAAQAMPSITAADQLFTTGPVKINGTALEGIQDLTIDFGLRLVASGGSGCPFPEFIAIDKRQPVITAISTHVDFPTESGMALHVAQGSTDSVAYLRKIAQNGAGGVVRVADATTEHISFTMDDGIVTIRETRAATGEAAIEVVLEPSYDGSNAILVVSTAAAIA